MRSWGIPMPRLLRSAQDFGRRLPLRSRLLYTLTLANPANFRDNNGLSYPSRKD